MAEPQENGASKQDPTNAQVLRAIADALDPGIPLGDRIVVQQGTTTQYAYRVYVRGESEYEGGVLTLE